jgi:hypothetical protein
VGVRLGSRPLELDLPGVVVRDPDGQTFAYCRDLPRPALDRSASGVRGNWCDPIDLTGNAVSCRLIAPPAIRESRMCSNNEASRSHKTRD